MKTETYWLELAFLTSKTLENIGKSVFLYKSSMFYDFVNSIFFLSLSIFETGMLTPQFFTKEQSTPIYSVSRGNFTTSTHHFYDCSHCPSEITRVTAGFSTRTV